MAKFSSFDLINETIQAFGRRTTVRDESVVRRDTRALRALSDAELSDRCMAMLKVGPTPRADRGLGYLLHALRKILSGSSLDRDMTRYLAHAIEAFRRAPADLGPGAQLYPEQEQASIALLQNAIIQMETGEGKTYALLPAAFALAVQHRKAYILCANDFLARRDAARTAAFWNFVGVTPGVADEGCDPREWSRRVVYTTISQLLFKYMNDQNYFAEPAFPLVLGGVLMDDADVVLLDEASDHTLVVKVKAEAFKWDSALAVCRTLLPDEDIKVNDEGSLPFARLTVAGEQKLRDHLGTSAAEAAEYLLMRQAVELAYLATEVLVEGNHYVVQGDQVYPISRVDGRIRKDWTPAWLSTIQNLRGLPVSPESFVIHVTRPSVLLKRFLVSSGVSGTVSSDAIEFLFGYLLRPVRINPRFKRRLGRMPDVIYPSKRGALNGAVQMAAEAVAEGRPVLVGTHTLSDAETCYAMLRERLPDINTVTMVTGQNVDRDMHLIEDAGTVGAVMVATQVAGRGVDIRLSEEARANGGLLLIGLGHSPQVRHDRQFLGRAGRHGDPFTAIFLCSLDDEFFRGYRVNAIKSIYSAFKIEEDVPIRANALLQKQINQIQQDHRLRQLRQRRTHLTLDYVDTKVGSAMEAWHRHHQTVDTTDDGREVYDECSADFVAFAIERFLETNAKSMVDVDGPLTAEQAERLSYVVSEVVGYNPHVANQRRLASNLTGRTGADARELVGSTLTTAITTAATVNSRRRSRLEARVQNEDSAALLAYRLGNQIGRLDEFLARVHERRTALQREDTDLDAISVSVESERTMSADASVTTDLTAVAEHHGSNEVLPGLPDGTPSIVERLRAAPRIGLEDLETALDEAVLESDLMEIADLGARWRQDLIERRNRSAAEASVGTREMYERHNKRTPRQAAMWAMRIAHSRFATDRTIALESQRRSNSSTLHYLRSLNDEILHLWDRNEAEMSREVLTALARSWYLPGLDPIFLVSDYAAPRNVSAPQSGKHWQASATDAPDNSRQHGDDLITSFLRGVAEKLRTDEERRRVTELIRDFLAGAPLAMLQAPEQIALRIFEWRALQQQRFRRADQIRADLWWLSRFLQFLRDRGAIAELPTPGVNLRATVGRIVKNLGEMRTIVPIAGAATFAVVMTLLAQIHLGRPARPTPLVELADALLSGGLLTERSIVGPVIAAMVASMALWGAVNVTPSNSARINMALLPLALGMVWAASPPWSDPFSMGMAWAAVAVIGGFWIFFIAAGAEVQLELWANLQLRHIWLCGAVLLAFLPRLIAMGQPEGSRVLAAFVIAVAGISALYRLNTAKLLVEFRHVESVRANDEGKDLAATEYRIEGTPGARPHGLALLVALLFQPIVQVISEVTHQPALDPRSGSIMSVVVYLAVVLTVVFRTVNRRCSLSGWGNKLNEMRQVLHHDLSGNGLDDVLRSNRIRLTVIEGAAQSLLVLVAFVLIGIRLVPGTLLPVALPLAFGAAIVAEQGRRVLGQLRSVLFLRSRIAATAVDLPAARTEETERPEAAWRHVGRRFLQVAVTVVGLLLIIASVVEGTTISAVVSGWVLR